MNKKSRYESTLHTALKEDPRILSTALSYKTSISSIDEQYYFPSQHGEKIQRRIDLVGRCGSRYIYAEVQLGASDNEHSAQVKMNTELFPNQVHVWIATHFNQEHIRLCEKLSTENHVDLFLIKLSSKVVDFIKNVTESPIPLKKLRLYDLNFTDADFMVIHKFQGQVPVIHRRSRELDIIKMLIERPTEEIHHYEAQQKMSSPSRRFYINGKTYISYSIRRRRTSDPFDSLFISVNAPANLVEDLKSHLSSTSIGSENLSSHFGILDTIQGNSKTLLYSMPVADQLTQGDMLMYSFFIKSLILRVSEF